MELYSQQAEIFNRVVKDKKSVFVTGQAGTGKSALMHSIYSELKREGYEIICVSFTGKAALNMPGQGTTVSRNVGMKRGKDDYLPINCFDRAVFNGVLRPSITSIYKKADQRWQSRKLAVFIDEAGQLSSENARLFFDIGMLKRKDKGLCDIPLFVFTADFGQLPPIKGKCILEPAEFEFFKAPNLKDTLVLPSIIEEIEPEFRELTKIVRQSDEVYVRALRWVYYGIAVHPAIKERFYVKPPERIKRVMFNNDEVVAENNKYVKEYIKNNPNKKVEVFKALYDQNSLYSSYLKDLIPVTPEMTIAEGMTFNVTENIPDLKDKKKLLVANGETVIVSKILNTRAIKVLKTNGEEIELGYVQHSLPVDAKNNKPTFLQLPGYAGTSLTIYRCVAGYSKVWSNGLTNMHDLNVNHVVNTGLNSKQRVLNKINSGLKKIVRLTTNLGYQIDVSEEHPLLTRVEKEGNIFVQSKELKIGDYLCIDRKGIEGSEVELPDPILGKRVYQPIRTPKVLNEEVAWVLGALVGDGSYSSENESVEFTKPDDSLNHKYKSILESWGLKVGYYMRPNKSCPKLYTWNRGFKNWIRQLGLGPDTYHAKKAPYIIFNSNIKCRSAFLKGLFDTDGASENVGGLVFSTCSKQLAKDVHFLLLSIGIISNLSYYFIEGHKYFVRISGLSELEKFYSLVGFTSERKQKGLKASIEKAKIRKGKTNLDIIPFTDSLFKELKEILVNRNLYNAKSLTKEIKAYVYAISLNKQKTNYRHLQELSSQFNLIGLKNKDVDSLLETNYFYDKLVSIEFLEEETEMYDIEVENDHAFVANGFVCHNCQGQTYKEPIEFGAWQWIKKNRRSLKNHPGSLYVMLSRNTSLDDLYFDTSFGIEEAINLLKSAVTTNPYVQKYVKDEKPIYVTDPMKETIVVELEDYLIEDIDNVKTVSFKFRNTRLDINNEKVYAARYLLTDKKDITPLIFWEVDEKNNIEKCIKEYKKIDLFEAMHSCVETWLLQQFATL